MSPGDATPLVSVAIPAFNEAATILEVLRRVKATPYRKEILVVDDGSSDGTADRVEALRDPEIRVARHAVNRGKGAALRTAFEQARGEVVVVQDADLEYDPADHPSLLAPILDGRADAVYGSRFLGGAGRVLYYRHRLGNAFLTMLSNFATDLNLTDMETGAKAVRRSVLSAIDLVEERFGFEVELTAKLARAGVRVWEVSVSYRGRTYAEGKKIGWRDGVAALACIWRYGVLHR